MEIAEVFLVLKAAVQGVTILTDIIERATTEGRAELTPEEAAQVEAADLRAEQQFDADVAQAEKELGEGA